MPLASLITIIMQRRNFLIKTTLLLLLLIPGTMLAAQTIARLTVHAGTYNRQHTPVSISLDQLTTLPAEKLRLEEITASGRHPLPFQVEAGYERKLWWIISGQLKAGETRSYELLQGIPHPGQTLAKGEDDNESLVMSVNNQKVLQYNHRTVYPPKGVDTAYRRSGFIHPLWSPQGAILTSIQPKDHYHHYGFWNPWTYTLFEGKEFDFWNLARKQGTVQFNSFASVVEGPVFGSFKALQDHVIYPDSAPRTIMNETWDVRVYNIPAGYFLWDFTSTLNLAVESPLTIKEYRYAGLGMRATPEWTNTNSHALTSEGKTRADADGSVARWCFINGETAKGMAGILFMSYPANYNHPEPIRMWPADANNGRGDVFFNFCPTKNTDWVLNPGNDYTLKYRMLVFEGEISREAAEAAWADFAFPPKVTIQQ